MLFFLDVELVGDGGGSLLLGVSVELASWETLVRVGSTVEEVGGEVDGWEGGRL